MNITKESLIEFGMVEPTDKSWKAVFPLKKIISLPSDDDEDEMSLCVTLLRNQNELALLLPDGGILYLSIDTIEDLKTFEKCIATYEFPS